MKIIIMISALVASLVLGLYGGLAKPKPNWWKVLVILAVTGAVLINLLPPLATGGNSNAFLAFPYITSLMERVRILNFHVPMAWIAVLSYLISMVYSVRYLRKRDIADDIKSSASALLGLVFTILATVTGMLWAKFNWGAYWNWDPRETSIFILMMIYFAYFALRSAIENETTRARLSSVYSLLAFATVPFFMFVLPRLTTGLHPSSGGEGPVTGSGGGFLNSNMQWAFGVSFFAFTMLYFWALNLGFRVKLLQHNIENQ